MVNISHETAEQTQARLQRVIGRCDLKIYEETYAFLEFPVTDFPEKASDAALALVRDDEVWSQLVPCDDPNEELFAVWRFHFHPDDDNSGFISWITGHLKEKFGSGAFVTCGQNRNRGGIFDYTGCPAELGPPVFAELRRLTADNAKA